MAEVVIRSLVLKIGDILADEATKSAASLLLTRISAMKELMKDISEIKDELESVQCFIRIVERLKEKDDSTEIFTEIRRLAVDIEVSINEFTHKLGKEKGRVLPTAIKRCRNIKIRHQLSNRLKEKKIVLKNIMERRMRFDMKGMENEAKPLIAVGSSKSRAESAHLVEEDDIVGFDNHRELLLGWLKDEDAQQEQHMIISVMGMGGLGKTTLVTHVYNKIKATFDACAWVYVSQSYETIDLLRKILKGFYGEDHEKREAPNNIDTMNYISLVETIRTYLQCKKYVLILDDVWSTNVMDKIKYALLNSNCESRIILTTRIRDVALLANEHRMFELKPLEGDHPWDLFHKNAFWKIANKSCPPLLEQCAKKFVKKCGGLPLAIVSIGHLLSFREQTNSEWEEVYKDFEWYLTNILHDEVHNILKLSLDNLPRDLRNCFLYYSSFPEDYEIESETLIRFWVAEGFIEERSERTMEDVAQDYLKELVHRCLLQVPCREIIDTVHSYQMHDIIRVLARFQSKEESFCMVYENSGTMLQLDRAHPLSILIYNNSMSSDLLKSVLRSSKLLRVLELREAPIKELPSEICDLFNLRYLGLRATKINELPRSIESLKFLRVLELRGAPIKELPSEICNLFNLHYLGLGATKIKELPRSIGRLQNLQILDIDRTGIEKLPKEITKLQKLKHLVFPNYFSNEAPMEIWHLKGLQILRNIKATTKIVRDVEALTELRTFGINGVTTDHCKDLWNSITKMNNLSNLSVESESWQELRWLDIQCPPLPIQKLYLQGKLDKTSLGLAAFFGSLTNLTELTLSMAKLDEDTFPHLQALPALMVLELFLAYDSNKLHFRATSFPKLKDLLISVAPKLNQVEIESGAMPSLNRLFLHRCLELRELPHGIEYLTTLQDLFMYDPAEKLIERLRGEGDHNNNCRTRVCHISKITIYFERDGEYVEERIQ